MYLLCQISGAALAVVVPAMAVLAFVRNRDESADGIAAAYTVPALAPGR